MRLNHKRRLVAGVVTLAMIAVCSGGSWSLVASDTDIETLRGWTQWRGPHRDGHVDGPVWPASLGGLEPMWRVELGKGYSGPVVSDGRVYVLSSWPGGV